jgi:serine/threonine protein kinase
VPTSDRSSVSTDAGEASAGPPARMLIAGKYRIERLLAEGGMGRVYAATHADTHKRVAVKVLRDTGQSVGAQARLLREAQAVGRINHPNIVDVYDVGEHEGFPFLVMELLEGHPLSSLFASGPMNATTALALVLPAMRGVAAAHEVGVVHRDIKPENIFVCATRGGSLGRVKVLDFGISKIRKDAAALDMNLTVSGTVVGTPRYMAPEQLTGSAVDARTDVYAFGVLLYEALAGKTPFDGDTFAVVAAQKLNKPPRALHKVVNVERGLSRLVMRALAIEPKKRFSTLEDFATSLEAYSDVGFRTSGVPLPVAVATSESATVFVAKPERRVSRIAATLAIAGSLLFLIGLGIALGAWIVNRSREEPRISHGKDAPPIAADRIEAPVETVSAEEPPVGQAPIVEPAAEPAEGAPGLGELEDPPMQEVEPAPRGRTGRLSWDDF